MDLRKAEGRRKLQKQGYEERQQIKATIARNIRCLGLEAGMTQADLGQAAQLGKNPVKAEVALRHYEIARRCPPIVRLRRIPRALGDPEDGMDRLLGIERAEQTASPVAKKATERKLP